MQLGGQSGGAPWEAGVQLRNLGVHLGKLGVQLRNLGVHLGKLGCNLGIWGVTWEAAGRGTCEPGVQLWNLRMHLGNSGCDACARLTPPSPLVKPSPPCQYVLRCTISVQM